MTLLSSQLLRFGLVSIASNLILYALFIFLTAMGIEHKLAMTLLYITGVLQTFLFNKKWTFRHDGKAMKSFIAYVTLYTAGYLINLSILFYFVDMQQYSAQWVQGAAIIILAGFFFLMQKLWVFK